MHFEEQELYHVYNCGNFKQRVFFEDADYRYFIKKIKKHLVPVCDILAWTLLPNHFHFQIHCNEVSIQYCTNTPLKMQKVSQALKTILSSYSQRINKKQGRFGNLFKQKTKSKLISDNFVEDFNFTIDRLSYASTVFHYIHLNPFSCKLVRTLEEWKFSSYNEYIGKSEFNLCKKEITKRLLNIDLENFSEVFTSAISILCPLFENVPVIQNTDLRKKAIFI